MTPDEIAGENLGVLRTYSPSTFNNLEKRCRSHNGSDKVTRRNMRRFLITHGLALTVAPGHGTSAPGKGKGIQPGTQTFLDLTAKALRDN